MSLTNNSASPLPGNGKKHYFFCGIGGSGMLPLAIILKGLGHDISGSDRSRDQGRTAAKFAWLEAQGIKLFSQDGSGVTDKIDSVVISTAVEDSIPDIAAARHYEVPIVRRAEILAQYFNAAKKRIAIGGTSGKTTTTGMTGFLLKEAGFDPTVMNGGIFRNYADGNPYATALVGQGDVFVTEADESDGSIALYKPDIAVLHNITLDHKPMAELRSLFTDFAGQAGIAVVNLDDPEARALSLAAPRVIGYSLSAEKGDADITCDNITPSPQGIAATVRDRTGISARLDLPLPGQHNLSNALAALAVGLAMDIPLDRAAAILSRFEGIKRRMEFVGTANGITVFDDFAHNPDKIAATLSALKQHEGRLHVFFQPHGYGFLKLVRRELVQTFASHLGAEDCLYLTEPHYAGGTVDRSIGSADIVADLKQSGVRAELHTDRGAVKAAILAQAAPSDRIVVMGARDDTLSDFAQDLFRTFF